MSNCGRSAAIASDEACAEIGRDPSEIMRSSSWFWDPASTPDLARSFRDAGLELLFVIFNPLGDPAEVARAAEALGHLA